MTASMTAKFGVLLNRTIFAEYKDFNENYCAHNTDVLFNVKQFQDLRELHLRQLLRSCST